ncbi:AAA family ATPase [Patescibacteria group bacterium]|nr:AAA family ATPase [Patescibacteria group bacterium]
MNKLLIILTGKTASGKDTVMLKLLSRFPNFKKVITTTSRAPRDGEINDKDYHFISKSEFQEKLQKGDFIEWVEYAGNFYGTEKEQIVNNLDQSLIWRIDPSRAGQIRQFIKDAFDQNLAEELLKRVLVIYLTVEDEVILKRLEERNLNQEEIDRRMAEDTRFWLNYKDNYDFVVENVPGKLDETVDKIVGIIENRFS